VTRRLVLLAGFATGAAAATVLYRRSTTRRREHVDVYFEDGSMVSFLEGSAEAENLIPAARRALAAARR